MKQFYFTFGSGHTHITNYGEQSLGGCYCVIQAADEGTAREMMNSARGPAWAFCYNSGPEAGVERFGLRPVVLDDIRLPQETPAERREEMKKPVHTGLLADHPWLQDAPIKVLSMLQACYIGGCRTAEQMEQYTGINKATISVTLGVYAKAAKGRPPLFDKMGDGTRGLWQLAPHGIELMETVCMDQGLNLAKETMPDYLELYGEQADPFQSSLTSRFHAVHEYLMKVDGVTGTIYRLQVNRAAKMIDEIRILRKASK